MEVMSKKKFQKMSVINLEICLMLYGQSPQAHGSNCIALCDGIVHCQSWPVGHC